MTSGFENPRGPHCASGMKSAMKRVALHVGVGAWQHPNSPGKLRCPGGQVRPPSPSDHAATTPPQSLNDPGFTLHRTACRRRQGLASEGGSAPGPPAPTSSMPSLTGGGGRKRSTSSTPTCTEETGRSQLPYRTMPFPATASFKLASTSCVCLQKGGRGCKGVRMGMAPG